MTYLSIIPPEPYLFVSYTINWRTSVGWVVGILFSERNVSREVVFLESSSFYYLHFLTKTCWLTDTPFYLIFTYRIRNSGRTPFIKHTHYFINSLYFKMDLNYTLLNMHAIIKQPTYFICGLYRGWFGRFVFKCFQMKICCFLCE